MTVVVSRPARVLSSIGIVAIGGTTVVTIATESLANGTRAIAIAAFVCFGLYVAFWRPRLIIGTDGVVVVNPFVTHALDWGAIARIDTKWGLTLFTKRRRVNVWAAPAPGRHAALTASREQGQYLPESTYVAGTVRPGDLVTSESGSAAALVRRAWESRSDESGDESSRVVWPVVGAFVATAVAAVLAVVY